MFWNKYPYTNFHELNLDWILETIRHLYSQMNEFIIMNTIKYADPFQWNITTQYEANTIVVEPNSGIAYISTKPVPAGVAITNTDYWTPVFDLSQLFTGFNDNITFHNEELNLVSGAAYSVGDWLIWKNELYRVKQPINVGDSLVVDTNIERKTVEELVKDIEISIDSTITNILDMIDHVKVINVLDHGAKADGVTDDSQVFNDCIALASSQKKAVYVPNGTYLIGQPIVIDSALANGVKIFGVISGFGSGSTLKTTENIPIFDVTQFCEISDLVLIGTNNNAYTDQIGIRINNCNSVRVHDCNFFSFYNCIEIIDTVFYSKISNCRFSSCVNAMIRSYEATSSPGGFNVVFENLNVIANSGTYGFQLGNIGSFIMSDCEVSPQNLSCGLYLENEATSAGMSMIENSGFETVDHAIIIGDATHNVKNIFFSNVYAGSGSSAVLLENASSIYFNGGDITGGTVGTDGLVHYGTHADDIKFSHILFNTPVGCFTTETACDNFDLSVDNCTYPGPIFLYIPNIPWARVTKCIFDNCNVKRDSTMFQYPTGAYPIIRCRNDAGVITSTEVYKGTLDASGNADVTVHQYGINNQVANLKAYYKSGAMPVELNAAVTGTSKVSLSGGANGQPYALFVTYVEDSIWTS